MQSREGAGTTFAVRLPLATGGVLPDAGVRHGGGAQERSGQERSELEQERSEIERTAQRLKGD